MSVTVSVRVQTRASRSAIEGFREGVLRVRVTAAPTGGEANEALITLLAKSLGIGKTRVSIVRGHSAREKTIAIEGITHEQLRERVRQAI